jgi:predicted kinase
MASLKVTLPRRTLLVLCGPAGCGKSTFAAPRFLPTEIVSSDACRAMICDDDTNQRVNHETFNLFHYIIDKRLRLGRFTVADSTALHAFARRRLLDQAHRSGYSASLLIFNAALQTCLARDLLRPRSVGEQIVQYHLGLLQQTLLAAPQEGWDQLYVLDEDAMETAQIELVDDSIP